MRFHRCAVALVAGFLFASGAMAAPPTINAEAQKLLDAGTALSGQGKMREALDAYGAAIKADPASSLPLSMRAGLLYNLSLVASGEAQGSLRAQAIAGARAALAIDNDNPIALETLRLINDDAVPPAHKPNEAAARQIAAGEDLFNQKHYAEALAQYEQAIASDPLAATAWVYAGDCYFAQQQWPQAEARFMKAAEVDPLMGMAWRYLADALFQQGRSKDAQNALFGGIAAQPNQLPTWDKLAGLMRGNGTPLKRLDFQMKVAVQKAASGKININIDDGLMQQDGNADGVFWLSYGLAKAKYTGPAGFASDFDAMQEAFKIDAELAAKDAAKPFAQPALATLRQLHANGRLESALLLLLYRESYRPALEAWKKAHPDGVREFVVATGLRP